MQSLREPARIRMKQSNEARACLPIIVCPSVTTGNDMSTPKQGMQNFTKHTWSQGYMHKSLQ